MKKILVTGSNKGIGLAIVKKLLNDFNDTFLILGTRNKSNGEAALEEIKKNNKNFTERIIYIEQDVENEDSVKESVKLIRKKFKDIDLNPLYGLVNNAGISGSHHNVKKILEVNTFGVKRISDSFIPILDQKIGRIVNITSASGPSFVNSIDKLSQKKLTNVNLNWNDLKKFIDSYLTSNNIKLTARANNFNAYGFSKACTNSLTLCLAKENPSLIINACTPGFIYTDLTKHMLQVNNKTAGELGMKMPSDGANVCVFLLMNKLSYNGAYYGSDCERSPLDKYRSPGDPPYKGL